jgi:hypothetical protein
MNGLVKAKFATQSFLELRGRALPGENRDRVPRCEMDQDERERRYADRKKDTLHKSPREVRNHDLAKARLAPEGLAGTLRSPTDPAAVTLVQARLTDAASRHHRVDLVIRRKEKIFGCRCAGRLSALHRVQGPIQSPTDGSGDTALPTTDNLLSDAVAENIDALVTLDLRGYGVPRSIYAAARAVAGQPIILSAARAICGRLHAGAPVIIATGFVFPPWHTGELDGVVGAAVVARALELAAEARPVLLCEEELVPAMSAVVQTAGLQPRVDVDRWRREPRTALVHAFTKDDQMATRQARELLDELGAEVAVSIERPGRSTSGVYHMGNGTDVTALAAKIDRFFEEVHRRGGLTVAIGDLGNEMGMGAIREGVRREVPFGRECGCPCGAGIAAEVQSDHTIVGAVSDWAAYGLAAAIAFVSGKREALHTGEMEKRLLRAAVQAGLVDGSGYAIPSVDGIDETYNARLVETLGDVIEYPVKTKMRYRMMFERVKELRAAMTRP